MEADSSSVTYVAEDGQEVTYEQDGGGFEVPAGHTSRLAATSSGFELSTKEHEKLSFDADGRLVTAEDSSGQGVSLSYSGAQVDTVTDATGREFDIEFNNDGFISSIELPDGDSVQYTYDGDLLTSVTDLRGGVTEYEYNSSDQLISITDALGNTIMQSTYDSEGRVVEQIDASGGVTEFDYAKWGQRQLTMMTDPLGGVTRDEYFRNVLVETETPLGAVTTYAYDERLRMVRETDPHGRVTEHSYDDDDNRTRTEYANGDVEEFTYSPDGELLTQTSAEGRVTEYTYDSNHRVVTETDDEGGVTTYTYNSDGQVATVTSPEGRTTEYDYDADGNRIEEASPEGRTSTFEYDSLGRPVSETTPRGNESGADPADFTGTFTYDDSGNLVSSTDPEGHATEFDYDLVGQQTHVTDPLQRETVNTYDAAGNLVSVTEPGGAVTTHEYDLLGNRTSTTDPEGGETTWTYDADGRMVSMTTPRGNEAGADPDDHTWTYEYDGVGNLVSETDPQGRETTYGYDERYRQISVTDPLGNTTLTEYDGDSNVVSTTDPLGNTTETVYNGLNLPVEVTDPAGETTTMSYDDDGLLISETTPLGHTTTYGYDDDGLRVSRTTPRGNESGADPADHTWHYAHDADGNLVSTTDPLGNETTTTFDARGLPVTTTNGAGETTTLTYDAAGQTTSVTGPDGNDTTYTYTPAGDLETVTDPNDGVEAYGYDDARRPVSVTDPLGRTRSYGYDPDGNQTTEITARGPATGDTERWTITTSHDERGLPTQVTTGSAASSKSFTYDDNGQLTSFTDAAGTTTLTYNDVGQTTSVTRGSDAYAYTYDTRGLIDTVTYPDGSSFEYTYDASGRRTQVTLPGGQRENYTYDANGNLTRTSHDPIPGTIGLGSHYQTRSYDPVDNIGSIGQGRGNQIMAPIRYERDELGRPLTKATGLSTPYKAETYAYDDAGQLERVCYFTGTAPQACTDQSDAFIAYTYDDVGNRLGEERVGVDNPGTTTSTYDAANQLATTGGMTFTHDADGNLTSDGTTTWIYDEFNQLIGIDDGTNDIELTYDALGNRATVTDGSNTRALSWDINNPLPMLTSVDDGTDQATYRYDPTGAPVWANFGGDDAAVFTDDLGSVMSVYNRITTSRWWASDYEPFGALRSTSENTLTTDQVGLGFTGEYLDPTTDLLHLRLRDYNPTTGRFTATDPVTTPIGTPWVSPYAYASNQPTHLTDPSGACPWDWCVDLIGGLWGTYQDEGFPTREEINTGLGRGILQGGENTAHGLASRGNPNFTEATGWDGNYLADQIPNDGWYQWSSIAGEIFFYGGTAAIGGGAFGARNFLGNCPPGLITGRGPSSFAKPPAVNTGSRLSEASSAAFRAANDPASIFIKNKHLSSAGGNQAKFVSDDISQIQGWVAQGLRSSGIQFLPNRLDDTFRVIVPAGRVIGTKGQTNIRVIVTNDGRVINAFPVVAR
ncbi:RHS repeat-associated core domain-containing protein [Phytoactinopolyspora alkaliphila]|uniref:RHS repeat-associated core domain-containing protein n=1 Tax=Phytoactinopolyspora alkaliphila TaxID=1783498 RepID=A0A6N9YPS5_9ACTN|nr:RHS repeat-associated core domain-containing protein [Phytoactinopolyspora alkaliphila]